MSVETFYRNVLKMTIMWSCICFCTYLLQFQLKYLDGDIFTNNNVIALSDLAASLTGSILYQKYGLKTSYYLSFTIGIIGSLSILYLEGNHSLPLEVVKKYMPVSILFTKYGIAMGFLSSYFASFVDNRIFPVEKRATAIGICNVAARSLTGLSPIVNELKAPIPMACFVCLLFIALMNTTTIQLQEESKIIKKKRKN